MQQRLIILFISFVMTIQASHHTLEDGSGFPSYQGLKKALQTSSSFLPINTETPEDLVGDTDDLDISDYIDILERVSFYGLWLNTGGPNQLFNYFEKAQGFMSMQDSDSDQTDFESLDLSMVLYDGKYTDQRFAQFSIQAPINSLIFDQANASLSAKQLNVNATIGIDNNERQIITCLSDIDIYFWDQKAQGPFVVRSGKNIHEIGIQISFQSSNCSIFVSSETLTTTHVYQHSIMIYASLLIVSAIIGTISSFRIIAGFPETTAKIARVCVWSIWLINAWDFYMFIYHIALSVTISGWLMLVALSFFALAVLAQTKVVYGIYMSTNRSGSNATFLSGFKFFAFYYGLLYLLVFSYSYLSNSIWSVLSSSFYLVPQIILVFFRGRKYKFNLWHIFGLAVTRGAFVIYIKVYPDNIFRLSPNLKFVAIYFAIMFAQVTALSLQRILPRFCLTPKPFRYLVKVTDAQEKEEMCPICMDILKEQPFSLQKALLEDEKSVLVMQTPCKHRFHEDCLMMWMKTKLECPSCRQAVPSLNNEEVE